METPPASVPPYMTKHHKKHEPTKTVEVRNVPAAPEKKPESKRAEAEPTEDPKPWAGFTPTLAETEEARIIRLRNETDRERTARLAREAT